MRALIAEDDLVSCRLLATLLAKWGYEVVVTTNGTQAWQLLSRDHAPRLVILDWMMPGMDGIQVCQEIRKRAAPPYTYVILLTAKSQHQDMIAGLEAGADDCLSKPFDPHELRVRLHSGKRILDLQAQLLEAREALHVQATHDPLTGLWNRTAILEILERELARSQRSGNTVGVMIADLDHFKRVNDSHGHLTGDAVLLETARRMRNLLRLYDAVGRYGGEEFLIVSPTRDPSDALHLAERLRAGICEQLVNTAEGKIPLTLSIGVAVGEKAKDPESLLRAADLALYRAKEAGRNRVQLSATEGDSKAERVGEGG